MNMPVNNTEAWKRHAEFFLKKVSDALEHGISAELYADYPSPAEGFCFELYGDLPYANRPLMKEILSKMSTLPEFPRLDAEFRSKYGMPFIDNLINH
ncbi:hypothetical protein [Chromobacterium haemolyticum]|uniref:hypothetical protein n=1 Tax=Chromobacterium haemolyticum TaxID=394935 RepID=UPI00244B5A9B|nr:hypothetical protein [Chromobacterium haemolyticum]MDH0342157.1 hypothetical protein [Chromobacterium haemolyticum]